MIFDKFAFFLPPSFAVFLDMPNHQVTDCNLEYQPADECALGKPTFPARPAKAAAMSSADFPKRQLKKKKKFNANVLKQI